jgi:hypothetical protein
MARFKPGLHKDRGSARPERAREPSGPPKPLEWIKQRTWERFGWPGVIVLLAIGGAVTAWTSWERWQRLPGVSAVAQWTKETVSPIRASGRKFAVAIARLEGDPDRQELRKLRAALQKSSPGIEVIELERTILLSSGNLDEAMRAGHDEARRLLQESGAHALIWGEVFPPAGKRQWRLHWTVSHEVREIKSTEQYTPTEDVNLPPLFWEDLSDVLGAVVTASTAQIGWQLFGGYYGTSNELEGFLQRTEALLRGNRDRLSSAAWEEVR